MCKHCPERIKELCSKTLYKDENIYINEDWNHVLEQANDNSMKNTKTNSQIDTNDEFVGQLRGGVNQLLPCLNNYASFKNFTRHSMMITIMQGYKQ
jgi:hypothetical protein